MQRGDRLRSYGRRKARPLSERKDRLLNELLPTLRVPVREPAPSPLASLFRQPVRQVWLEIGFGSGEHLVWQAEQHPEFGFIGCEPFINGVSSLLVLLDEQESRNVRVFSEDARLLLRALPEGSIARAFLLFPDPWPKRRHEGRRFVNPEALDLLARALADNAEFRVATDHAVLQAWMPPRIAEHPAFALVDRANERPEDWPPTRYEAKALKAGRRPIYLTYRRRAR